ncbi:MAG: TIGR00266 family protein [Ruminococcus sp.]|jgi:uncharacterized protein (TIGR00266 family)
MNYKILGDSDCPLAQISLMTGETVKIENGSMAYTVDVELEGKLNSSKKGLSGVFGAIGRGLTSGESIFITHAKGISNQGIIGIAPPIPGKIHLLKVSGMRQYRLNTGAFLACDDSVNYVMKSQDISKALFGGSGGLFVMETQGTGDLLVSAFGDLLPLEVTPEHPIRVDNEHVVAWDVSLDYRIQVASGTFGFKTGEGLVNEFHGSGTVLIQTRNIHNLADALRPFFPTSTSN